MLLKKNFRNIFLFQCLFNKVAKSTKIIPLELYAGTNKSIHLNRYCRQSQSKISDVASNIEKASKIVVMCGAGLSTPSGIPDFRSPKTGIYDNLEKFGLPYAEAIFDISYFLQNPVPFNTWALEMFYKEKFKPNLAHYFIRILQEKGKLLKLYTQNVDGLERSSGIEEGKLCEAHGSFRAAACAGCGRPSEIDSYVEDLNEGRTPACESCGGLVKPGIVFFGEVLPASFQQYSYDIYEGDLLICIGTSLEVYPFAAIAHEWLDTKERLLINKQCVGTFGSRITDFWIGGDLIEAVTKISSELGWLEEIETIKKNG